MNAANRQLSRSTARRLLEGVGRARVLVTGDVILDEYMMGGASRLSPEAPVPVVEVDEVRVFPGGAANVALGSSRLGASTLLIGVVGDDADGARLAALLEGEPHLETVFLVDPSRPTTRKSRVVASGQQIVRFDHEVRRPLDAEVAGRVAAELERRLTENLGAVILSDYQKGVLCPTVLRAAIETAKAREVPCVVDPKLRDFRAYRGASVITPNLLEAYAATGADPGTPTPVLLRALMALLDGTSVVITEGEAGMTLQSPGEDPLHVFPRLRPVFDRTGAGDTVVAVLSAALAGGAELREAAELANVAAGVAVSKPGIVAIHADEILEELED